MTARHTLRHFRQELWQPTLMNRQNPDTWVQQGSRRYEDRVIEQTRTLLASHQPEPLSNDVQEQLDRIMVRSELELNDVHFAA